MYIKHEYVIDNNALSTFKCHSVYRKEKEKRKKKDKKIQSFRKKLKKKKNPEELRKIFINEYSNTL